VAVGAKHRASQTMLNRWENPVWLKPVPCHYGIQVFVWDGMMPTGAWLVAVGAKHRASQTMLNRWGSPACVKPVALDWHAVRTEKHPSQCR